MLNPKNSDCILLYKGTLSTFKIRVVILRKKSGPKKNIFPHGANRFKNQNSPSSSTIQNHQGEFMVL